MKQDRMKAAGFEWVGNGYKPLCSTERGLLTYKKHTLYFYCDGEFVKFAAFPRSVKAALMESTRVLERITRSEPQYALAAGNSVFVARRHSVVRLSLKDGSVTGTYTYRKPYIHTDRLAHIVGVSGFTECIAYGEYFANSKREEVCVFAKRPEDDEAFRCVYQFPAGAVRHIHSLVPDAKRSCVYILTGDEDGESGIWKATDDFKTVVPLKVGSQDYRSCIAFIREDTLTFATDIPSRQNRIARMDMTTTDIQTELLLPGSCTVGCDTGELMVFSTSVEAREPRSRSRLHMLQYLLSRTLADGMKDDCPRLYVRNRAGRYKEYLTCKKDRWPGGLCRFGRIFPLYDARTDTLYVFPIAVKRYDGKLYKIPVQTLISLTEES